MTTNINSFDRNQARDDLVLLIVAFATPYLIIGAIDWRPLGTIIGPGFWAVTTAIVIMGLRYFLTGRSLTELGLGRPLSWRWAIIALPIILVTTAVVANTLQPWLSIHLGPDSAAATARFHELEGNLGLTVFSVLVVAWFGAAFGEEFVFRGVLMQGLIRWWGGGKTAQLAALFVQAGLFGSLHIYQGLVGTLMAASIGLIFGMGFFVARGFLWPVILVHAVPDTMTLLSNYQGG